MAHTVKISDGTTTIDFRGANYSILLNGWVPNRAQRIIGGIGLHKYAPVVEELRITIKGTSSSDVMTRLTTLSNLLDQVDLWRAEDSVTAVYFEYEPPGSGLAASVKSTIIGPPPDGVFLRLPSSFDFILQGTSYQLGTIQDPIVLRFTRLGVWLGATEVEASSASTGNPAILTSSTFTDTAPIPWPYDVELDIDIAVAETLVASTIVMLYQNAANKLYFTEAESMTLGSGVTSETDTDASAGAVARMDSQTNTSAKNLLDNTLSLASGASAIALYVVARNRSASTVTWTLWGEMFSSGNQFVGNSVIIEAGDNARQIIYLGNFYLPADIDTIYVYGQNDVTGAAADADDLDIDYVCGIVLDDKAAVIKTATTNAGLSNDREIHIDHQLLTSPTYLAYDTNSGGGTIYDYLVITGGLPLFNTGSLISCLVFGVSTDGSKWVIRDVGNNEANLTLNVTRYAAYLLPK